MEVTSLREKIIRDTRFCNCSECADESEHCDARLAFVWPTSRVVRKRESRVKTNNEIQVKKRKRERKGR